MSGRVSSVLVASVVLLASISTAAITSAAEWHPPIEGGSVLLGFGAPYPGGTHRGVDIGGASGAEILAPAEGTITFVGQVPADGGGTCIAVTLELTDGRKMSLLPLDAAEVVAGESVEAGQALGSLASAGDDSSAAAHVHVSLRSGDLYLDPGDLLADTAVVSAEPLGVTPGPSADPPGGTDGGTPVPCQVPGVATATGVSLTAAVPVQTGAAEPGTAAEPAATVSLTARKPGLAASGVPEASALMPANWRGTARDVPVLAPIDSRMAAGTGLACAMVAAAAGIVLSRRAHPVRVN